MTILNLQPDVRSFAGRPSLHCCYSHHAGLPDQGLLSRPDWESARRVPIAHVPGGSGNGLAHSCGLPDAHTAAFAICKAVVSPMDMASVLQPPASRQFIMLSVAYGTLANLDINTERFRWMGDVRFTLGAIWVSAPRRRTRVDAFETGSALGSSPVFTLLPIDYSVCHSQMAAKTHILLAARRADTCWYVPTWRPTAHTHSAWRWWVNPTSCQTQHHSGTVAGSLMATGDDRRHEDTLEYSTY